MAEVAVPGQMFQEIVLLIAQLRAPSAPADREIGADASGGDRQRRALIKEKQRVLDSGAGPSGLAVNERGTIKSRCSGTFRDKR